MKKPIYVIEHLEPQLFEWCLIEYEHISELVGGENLWFTNIKQPEERKKLEKLGKVFSESVSKMSLKNACVLDPEAEKILSPEESNFDYFVFGGILGDYPPKKRTKQELTKFMPNSEKRNIGHNQMSTDNAVFAVKQIIENHKKFEELKFKDKISLKINEFESIDLPYRYNVVGGKPFMSSKLIDYLRKKEGF